MCYVNFHDHIDLRTLFGNNILYLFIISKTGPGGVPYTQYSKIEPTASNNSSYWAEPTTLYAIFANFLIIVDFNSNVVATNKSIIGEECVYGLNQEKEVNIYP
jgi:hypothetical protein